MLSEDEPGLRPGNPSFALPLRHWVKGKGGFWPITLEVMSACEMVELTPNISDLVGGLEVKIEKIV